MSQSHPAIAPLSGTPLTTLSEDETMFRASVREFAEGEIRPRGRLPVTVSPALPAGAGVTY